MKHLRDLLRDQQIVSVSPDVTVRQAAKAMAGANVGCVAILEGDSLVGIFTERDVLKRVLLHDRKTDQTRVSEVMTTEVITALPEASSNEGRALLREHHIRHLPVVEAGGRLLGILSIRDLMRDEVDDAREAVEELHRFVQGGEVFEGETEND